MATPTSDTKKENDMQEPASIDMETFQKIDLRIGRVVSAEAVEGADKLLKLMVDIGEAKPRTVFSGIKAAYSPDDLLGKEVVVIANLQPRKMRFGVSEAMILAAGDGTSIALITPDKTTQPGAKVK
jgi:methionyl-tRNA synthetase